MKIEHPKDTKEAVGRVTRAVVGVFIMLSAIWIGFYINHNIPTGHWTKFPVFLTCLFVFVIGWGIIITAADADIDENY